MKNNVYYRVSKSYTPRAKIQKALAGLTSQGGLTPLVTTSSPQRTATEDHLQSPVDTQSNEESLQSSAGTPPSNTTTEEIAPMTSELELRPQELHRTLEARDPQKGVSLAPDQAHANIEALPPQRAEIHPSKYMQETQKFYFWKCKKKI